MKHAAKQSVGCSGANNTNTSSIHTKYTQPFASAKHPTCDFCGDVCAASRIYWNGDTYCSGCWSTIGCSKRMQNRLANKVIQSYEQ